MYQLPFFVNNSTSPFLALNHSPDNSPVSQKPTSANWTGAVFPSLYFWLLPSSRNYFVIDTLTILFQQFLDMLQYVVAVGGQVSCNYGEKSID